MEAARSHGRDQEPCAADTRNRALRNQIQGLCTTVAFIRSRMQKVQGQTNGVTAPHGFRGQRTEARAPVC